MFRRRARTRTFHHNKIIASALSFVAGVVNIVGILSLHYMATNVTGHFGFLIEEALLLDYKAFLIYFLYIFFFFFGSFVSNFLVEALDKVNERYIYIIPAFIETLLLTLIAVFGDSLIEEHSHVIAYTLLFAMGLQNALVTLISNAIVRTTHLTGLFTDLGIEMSQLLFYKKRHHRIKLISTISLRLRIVAYFFLGGIVGGVVYNYFSFYALFAPATLLFFGIFYDYLKVRMIQLRNRFITTFHLDSNSEPNDKY